MRNENRHRDSDKDTDYATEKIFSTPNFITKIWKKTILKVIWHDPEAELNSFENWILYLIWLTVKYQLKAYLISAELQ